MVFTVWVIKRETGGAGELLLLFTLLYLGQLCIFLMMILVYSTYSNESLGTGDRWSDLIVSNMNDRSIFTAQDTYIHRPE